MDRATVKHVASLSRIHLNEDETKTYTDSLNNIFTLLEQMEKFDTEEVEPLYHPLEIVQRLRKDEPHGSDQHTLFQENAPLVEAGLYLVPQVIEHSTEE